MFDLFRRRDTVVRYVLTFFLVVIALSMVVTLVPGWGSGGDGSGGNEILAQIGDEKITTREMINNIQTIVKQRNIPVATLPALIDTFVDGMLNGRIMAWQAKQMGLTVSEQDLAASIKSSFPQLFPGGTFIGTETYTNFLLQNGSSVADFEENLKRDILRMRLKQMAGDGIVVAPKEIEDEYKANNEKIKVEYVSLSEEGVRKSISVSDADIEAEFNKSKASYAHPQRYSYSLAIIDEVRTAALMPVKDEDLLREYNKDKERFRVPERVRVRHILIKTEGKSAAELPAVEAKARDILKQAKSGGDFAALAKANSEDPGSKSSGGELGFITRGQTVKEFEAASFTLPPNQISDLVKTQFGYHIIQPLERAAAGIQPFEQVKVQLSSEVNRNLINGRMNVNAEQLRNALLKTPNDIDAVAAKFNALVVKQDSVELTGMFPGVGPSPELQTALSGLKPMQVGQVVLTQTGTVLVPMLRAIIPPSPKTLAEASEQVRQNLLAVRTREATRNKGPELVAKGKAAGVDFAKLAKEVNGEYKKTDGFALNGCAEGLGSGVTIAEAFKLPVGSVIGPVSMNEKQFVVRVAEHMPADMSKLALERESLVKKIKERKAKERTDLFEDALVEHLMQKGKVKVYEQGRAMIAAAFRS